MELFNSAVQELGRERSWFRSFLRLHDLMVDKVIREFRMLSNIWTLNVINSISSLQIFIATIAVNKKPLTQSAPILQRTRTAWLHSSTLPPIGPSLASSSAAPSYAPLCSKRFANPAFLSELRVGKFISACSKCRRWNMLLEAEECSWGIIRV